MLTFLSSSFWMRDPNFSSMCRKHLVFWTWYTAALLLNFFPHLSLNLRMKFALK